MTVWRGTEKIGLTNVRRFSQQTMEAHFDIQITAKEVPRIFYLNRDMSVATQKIMYGFLINEQRAAQFFSMYLFLFLTFYMFREHRAHHQERQIVSMQPLVAVGARVVCRSEVNFRPSHDTATDTE